MPEGARPQVYLDANIFVYLVEGEPALAAAVEPLFVALKRHGGSATTSELTLAEVLAPTGMGNARPAHIKRRYLDLIVWGRIVSLKPVSRDVLYETADVRTEARLRLPDAIHLVTAIHAKCSHFVSRDQGFRRMPAGMIKVGLGSPEMASLLADLP